MHTLARTIHLAAPATYRFQNSGAKYIQSSNINNKNKILWHFQNQFVSVLAICSGKKNCRRLTAETYHIGNVDMALFSILPGRDMIWFFN